jgi:hypothetical protein
MRRSSKLIDHPGIVVARHDRHRPFAVSVAAPRGAAIDAAVIASAHDVLVHYFPAQQAVLDADEDTSLGALQNSQGKMDGEFVGEKVAAKWIAMRANDGLEAPIVYTWGSGPGVWQPVPPFPPPATPWVASFTPFTYLSASDFLGTIDLPLAEGGGVVVFADAASIGKRPSMRRYSWVKRAVRRDVTVGSQGISRLLHRSMEERKSFRNATQLGQAFICASISSQVEGLTLPSRYSDILANNSRH